MSTESELIQSIQSRVINPSSVLVGIGDDAAIMAPTPDHRLVTTTDSLVLDRHFTASWRPHEIGHLAMTVNVSDLAAMGAEPKWAMLALTLPRHSQWLTQPWIEALVDGFLAACPGVALVGGNLSEGPLNIGVCLMGEVAHDHWVTRAGARLGDALLVTGTLGDATGALQEPAAQPAIIAALQERLHRPSARLAAGRVAADYARAMIDVSDGLLADLSHVLTASSGTDPEHPLGADIELADLPTSEPLLQAFPVMEDRWPLQLAGGSDYELLMAVAPQHVDDCLQAIQATQTPVQRIGSVRSGGGIRLIKPNGDLFAQPTKGWDHFS